MLRHEKSAPIWLFSFVDLAFLLLIAFTQIGLESSATETPIVQLEIPQIHGDGTPIDGPSPTGAWQLRVHPTTAGTTDGSHAAFELIEPGTAGAPAQSTSAIDADELAANLRLLRERATAKPVLAPHRDSRSEDLLVAVALLEDVWQGEGRAVAVRPGPQPAVAARPDESDARGGAAH